MGTISDYWQGVSSQSGGKALPFQLADNQLQVSNTNEDWGMAKSRLGTMYGRNLGDTVDRFSARGTVRGGGAGVAADRLREDNNYQGGQLDFQRNRMLSDLARNRVLATAGIML
jgi:hypothetical protein